MVSNHFLSFLQMGGYAATVWPAYGVVIFILLLQLFIAIRKLKCVRRMLVRKYAQPS